MKSDVEYDGKEDGATKEAQPKKYENPTSNIDTTNDNTGNSCTSASRNIDNGTETKSVTTNDEGNKGEGSETEAEAEAETETETGTNSEDSNSGNGIGSSNSKGNGADTTILKPPNENENRTMQNNVALNGDNSSETRKAQQQK